MYVDNDPVVLAHARTLLSNTTPEGVTGYVDADFHDPDLVIFDARNILNFTEPIAVMFMGVLGHVDDFAEMRSIVRRVMDAVPSGSHLSSGTAPAPATRSCGVGTCRRPSRSRTSCARVDQLAACFEGLELVEPGLVPITAWRPAVAEFGESAAPVDAYGALGRKP